MHFADFELEGLMDGGAVGGGALDCDDAGVDFAVFEAVVDEAEFVVSQNEEFFGVVDEGVAVGSVCFGVFG